MRITIDIQQPSVKHLQGLRDFLALHGIDSVMDYDGDVRPLSALDNSISFAQRQGMKQFKISIDLPTDDLAAECLLKYG